MTSGKKTDRKKLPGFAANDAAHLDFVLPDFFARIFAAKPRYYAIFAAHCLAGGAAGGALCQGIAKRAMNIEMGTVNLGAL